jgi:hypothetical protein
MKVRSPLLAAVVIGVVGITAGGASAAVSTQSAATPLPPGVVVHGLQYMPNVHLPKTVLPHLTPKASVESTDWSGYAVIPASGQQMSTIGADFNVPSLNCSRSPVGSSGYAYVSHWVGLDGYSDSTVEQTGVDAYCASGGTTGYDLWYEFYPLAPVAFSGVSPGDAISVTVTYNSTAHTYHTNVTDITTGGYVTSTQSCPSGSTCLNASAEVITEDPGGAVEGGYNLADFGMENYTGARTQTLSGESGSLATNSYWTSSEIIMVDPSSNPMATPSGLYSRGFNVAWNAAD